MRVHVHLDDELIRRLDTRVGVRGRSRFIAEAVERALEDEQRWELIHSAIGSIAGEGHEWDDNPAAWVHAQRYADRRRVG